MSGIDRIGRASQVTRDNPSEGLNAQERGEAKNAVPARNGKVDEVAKLYEKQFLREMVKAMRGTVSFGAEKPSMAENIYRDQLDSEYVEAWGDQGGIGLSELIYDQLMERYFNGGPGAKLKKNGPIAVTDRDLARVSQVPMQKAHALAGEQQGSPRQLPLRVEMKPSGDGSPAKLQSPWQATVLSKSLLDGKTSLTLGHEGGLKSTLVFQGVATADVKPGQIIERGKTIGVLSPEVNAFFWNISQSLGRPESDAAVQPDASRVTRIVSQDQESGSSPIQSSLVQSVLSQSIETQKD